MADRYKKILDIEPNSYSAGSPILICAGAVLSDSVTGKLLLQLKLVNVCDKCVSAIFVNVVCSNIAHEKLEGVDNYQYLDLKAYRNRPFGEKSPIILPDNTTRFVAIHVGKVVFADGEVWCNEVDADFQPLPKLKDINILGKNLIDQLIRSANKIHPMYGQFKNIPLDLGDLWFCACGTLNWSYENICSHCQFEKDWVFAYTTKESLQPLYDSYVLKQRAIKEEQERIEREEKEKIEERIKIKIKKIKKSGMMLLTIIILATSGYMIVKKFVLTSIDYKKATEYLDGKEYHKAIEAFLELGNYSNSEEMYLESKYQLAISYYEMGNYDTAIDIYNELGEYKDSVDIRNEILRIEKEERNERSYADAVDILSSNQNPLTNDGIDVFTFRRLKPAYETFLTIYDYKDVSELIMDEKFLLHNIEGWWVNRDATIDISISAPGEFGSGINENAMYFMVSGDRYGKTMHITNITNGQLYDWRGASGIRLRVDDLDVMRVTFADGNIEAFTPRWLTRR